MRDLLRGAGRAACSAALVAAGAGLAEGVLLAIVFDPFEAGWGQRAASVATFLAAYAAAGLIAGAILGAPLHWLARLARWPRHVASATACALLGLAYARAWCQALGGGLSFAAGIGATLAGGLLFGSAGLAAARRLPVHPALGAPAAAAMLLLVVAVSIGAGPATPDGSLAAVQAEPAGRAEPSAALLSQPARNLVLIVADTLRADHLSLYGYPRNTSPNLTSFAREAATFTNAIVQKTKTSPSVASLLTGTYPYTHGIVGCGTRLPDEAVTLAELLRDRRFTTHSIVANSNVGGAFNFDQGFASVDEIWADRDRNRAQGVTDHALAWLRGRAGRPSERFFLYVHYIDPHAPYTPPEPFAGMFLHDALYGRFAHIKVSLGDDLIGSVRPSARLPERPTDVDFYVARYDAEIAYLDHHLARLFNGIEEMGLDKDSLVIFTSDHGEALSEHEVFFGHGLFTYEDNAHVPLLARLPGRIPRGRRVEQVVQVSAIAATAMTALGLPAFGGMEVGGIWDLATGTSGDDTATGEEHEAYVEGGTVARALGSSIRTRRYKLMENPGGFDTLAGRYDLMTVLNMDRKEKGLRLIRTGRQFLSRFELYDLASDPGETVNLAGRERLELHRLHARLRAWRDRGAGRERLDPTPSRDLPDEVIQNLRSLGYIN